MRNRICLLLAVFICLTAAACRAAAGQDGDTAQDITRFAEIRLSRLGAGPGVITDGNYRTEWTGDRGFVEFILPEDRPCYTLYALTSGDPNRVIVEQEVAGRWQPVPVEGARFNIHCIPLNGLTHFRLAVTKGALRVMEARLYGAGELPPEVVNYHSVADKADLMVLACHPDDEVLWFAGLMPVYADRGYKVQLAMMTPEYEERQLELLQSAWHCGMRYYPYFIGLHDKNGHKNLARQYTLWKGKTRVHRLVTECFRKFKPEVVVTHGEGGEYGHSAHKATADSAKTCIKYAANSRKYPESAKEYGTWQVKKLYLHEYEKNKVSMDWTQPLESFGGKTGFDIAGESFLFHVS